MAKNAPHLDWCIVRLGEDQNWWVESISDDVHWDVDQLSIIDPRQVAYVLEMIEPLRDYSFDADIIDRAFIPFRIEKDLGAGRIRLIRTKESLLESEEKLFALPDVVDEENGPYADFLDHVTRCRVKMLNDVKDFDQKLTVDEVEEQIREEQNNLFMEGRAVHLFSELASILDYVPDGWEEDEEKPVKKSAEEDDEEDEIYQLEEEEEEQLKNDPSLKWDEEEEGEKPEGEAKEGAEAEEEEDEDAGGKKKAKAKALDDEDEEEEEDSDEEDEEDDEAPARSRSRPSAKSAPAAKPSKTAAPAPEARKPERSRKRK